MRPPVCQYDFKDPDLRSHGCTIASDTYLARMASAGDAAKDADWYAARLRELSGTSLADFRARGTTLDEAETAFEHAPGFDGRAAPAMRKFHGGSIRDDLIPAISKPGTWAVICVNYGAVQDAGKGVGSFRGGHAVVGGEVDGDDLTIADPLRRQLVKWKVSLLEKAAETFGDRPWLNGRGEFGIVAYAPTWQEQVQTLKATVADLRATDKARDRTVSQLTMQAKTLGAANAKVGADLLAAQARIAELEGAPVGCIDQVNAERKRVLDSLSDAIDEAIASLR